MQPDKCPICDEPLDEYGACTACDAATLEPLSDDDLALLYVDLGSVA